MTMSCRTNIRALAGAGSAALAAALLTAPAFAQADAAAEETVSTEDIVVTAQFRSQRLQDTPIAITALSAEALEARSTNNITDIAAGSPNVQIAPTSSSFGNSVIAYIRGIGQQDSNAALEPGVGIYIDDIYYGATFGAVFDLSDLERVEVLRGPQGTLAGKNSIGGAIKLFSQKPDVAGGGYVEATYGSFNRIDARAGANFTLADGLYARVSAVTKNRDGYMKLLDFGCANPGGGIPASPQSGKGCRTGREGGQSMAAGRLALRYAPDGSRLEINVIGDVTRDRSEGSPNKLISAGNPTLRSYDAADPFGGVPLDGRFLTGPRSFTSYATYRNGGNFTVFGGIPYQVVPGSLVTKSKGYVDSWGVSGTIDYELSDALSLKSISAYRKASGESGTDVDGSPIDAELIDQQLSHRQFTQELRLSGTIGTLINYTVGGFYYSARDRIAPRVEIPSVQFDFLGDDPVKSRSASVFTHVEAHLTSAFNLIGGLRYTDDRKSYTFSRRNPDGTIPSGIPFTLNWLLAGLDSASDTFEGNRLDYRLGLNYRFSDSFMAYAQVSTGFKGGGVNPRPYNPGQVNTFGPEKLTTYEAGFKSDLLDRRVRLNAAVFYNDYKDIQVNLLACPDSPCAAPTNAGNAHVKGAEAELTLRPAQGLTIEGSLSYLDFDYRSVNPATGIGVDFVAPFTSTYQASGSVEYAADLGGAGSLTPRLDWSYQSSFFFNADNSPGSKVAGRSVFNGRLTYQTADRDWSLALSVTNLFDKFYYLTKFDNSGLFGTVSGTPARPREWALTVKRRF